MLLQAELETENDRDAGHPVQNMVIYSTNEDGNAVLVETVIILRVVGECVRRTLIDR